MTREELRVGQILHDEKENCYLVYSINDSRNTAVCLNNTFTITSIGLDFLQYFHVDEEIDLDLLISELRGKQKHEDIVKAFQLGLAFGFGEKYDEMDKVIDEIKKVITQG